MIDSSSAMPPEAGGKIELYEALRRVLLRSALVVSVCAAGGYYFAEPMLAQLQALTGVEMVAYGLPDTFFSMLKLALALGLVAGLPYTFHGLLSVLPRFFPGFRSRLRFGFWIASVLLFAAGLLFCLKVTLPYGVEFLLGYQSRDIAALISVKRFVSFCLGMLLGFGLIFELPLAMMLLGRIGLVKAEQLAGYRRYAVLVISMVAAVLTPTPDVLNMTLMAVPLYLLFEIGLLGMRLLPSRPPSG